MIGRTLLAALVYVAGLLALAGWSVHGFASGAPREDWALRIVLPLAWALSFWPTLGSLLMIGRIRGLQRTFEGIGAELDAGVDPSPEKMRELEQVATHLAAHENHLPEFVVRPVVRKALARLVRDGSLARLAGRVRERAQN